MKKYNVLSLDIEKDEPSFVNDKAKWWLVETFDNYYLYRVLTNNKESSYIGIDNTNGQIVDVTQSLETALVKLELLNKLEKDND